jgi:hypothetical protein
MQKNIIARIALCGLLTATNITLAMDDTINKALILHPNNPTQQQSNKKTVFNGYYTNDINSLPKLPIYTYCGENSINNVSKITYTNTETNTNQIVRFSGKNNVNELLEYDNEKYHVIIDSKGDDLFAIKMFQTPTPTSSNSSPIQRSGNISPRDDYDDSKFISPTHSQSNSSKNSPRNKQVISDVLGGEKEIIHELILDNTSHSNSSNTIEIDLGTTSTDSSNASIELTPETSPRNKQIINEMLNDQHEIVYEEILDNTGRTYKQPSPRLDTITGLFAKDISLNIPVYDYVSHKQIDAIYKEITYKQDENNTKTITIKLENEYNDEELIIVQENIMGLNKQYIINLNTESIPTDINSDNDNSSTSSEETSLQTLYAYFSTSPVAATNIILQYEGSITKVEESNAEVTYEVTYTDENKKVQKIWVPENIKNPTYVLIRDRLDRMLFSIKLLAKPKDTTNINNEASNNSTGSEETSQNSVAKQQFTGFFTSEILDNIDYCEGLTIIKTHELHMKGFTTENFTLYPSDNYQYQIKYKNKTGDICTAIFNCSQQLQTTSTYVVTETDPIITIKLPTPEAETTQLTDSDETSLEQITETNNTDTKEDDSSNIHTRALRGYLTSNFNNLSKSINKHYKGKITNIKSLNVEITYTDDNNIEQIIWVDNTQTSSTPTYAIIKDNQNKVQFVIELPLNAIETDSQEESRSMNNDISKKSDFQRFNKNPNNRDPKYTYIGAAFLTLCIALAYKYNKLPDAFTKLLDQCFAQLNKLTPSRFSH